MRYRNLSSIPFERRAHVTQPKRVLHVFCEGGKTEPDYIKAYVAHLGNVPFTLKIVAPVGVAKTVVSAACDERQKAVEALPQGGTIEHSDEFWVVFDCDENEAEYQASVDRARANGVKVGCSNPCFELWLLLHFEHFDKPDNHRDLQKEIRRLCTEYNPEKNKTVVFDKIKNQVEQAEKRARTLRKAREKDGATRPETTFDLLTETLRQEAIPLRVGRPRELEGIKPLQLSTRRHNKTSGQSS